MVLVENFISQTPRGLFNPKSDEDSWQRESHSFSTVICRNPQAETDQFYNIVQRKFNLPHKCMMS